MDSLHRQAIVVWFALLFVMIGNGIVRESVMKEALGIVEPYAHQLSTLTAIAILFLVTYLWLSRWKAVPKAPDLEIVGALWLAATIIFEFGFGHYVLGHPWDILLADYNLFAGRLWPLYLAATATAPPLVGRYLEKNNEP